MIYELNILSYKDYIENTKHGKNCTSLVAKLKFSAMIETTPYIHLIDPNKQLKAYHIGKFCIIGVNNCITPYIPLIYWTDKSYPFDEKCQAKLKKNYNKYGLTPDGNFLK